MSKDSSSQSSSTSPHSTCCTASTHILRPRLPITYNEAALSCLHGRAQVKTLNNVSIPLPISSDEESPTAEAKGNSVHSLELSPASSPDPRLTCTDQGRSHQYTRCHTLPMALGRSHQHHMSDFPVEESPTRMKSQDQGTKKIETQRKLKALPLKTFAHKVTFTIGYPHNLSFA